MRLILKSKQRKESSKLILEQKTTKTKTENRNQSQVVKRVSWTNTWRVYQDLYCFSWLLIRSDMQVCMHFIQICPNSSRPSSSSQMWMLDTYPQFHTWSQVSLYQFSELYSTTSGINTMSCFCWPPLVWYSLCMSPTSPWAILQNLESKVGSFACYLWSYLVLVTHCLPHCKAQQYPSYSRTTVNYQTYLVQSKSQKV